MDSAKPAVESAIAIAAAQLSSITGAEWSINLLELGASIVAEDKFAVAEDQARVAVPFVGGEFAPVCILADLKNTAMLAGLAQGTEVSPEEASADDAQQDQFAQTSVQVLKATLEQMKQHSEVSLDTGDLDYKLITAGDEESQKVPDGFAAGFKIKLSISAAGKEHGELTIEIDQKLASHLADHISPKLAAGGDAVAPGADAVAAEDSVELDEDTSMKVDEARNLNFIRDISVDLILELGRADMSMKEVLRLTKGSAIELDRHCNEPVDLYVHNQLLARGEVVAIDECFGLKITEIVDLDLSKV